MMNGLMARTVSATSVGYRTTDRLATGGRGVTS